MGPVGASKTFAAVNLEAETVNEQFGNAKFLFEIIASVWHNNGRIRNVCEWGFKISGPPANVSSSSSSDIAVGSATILK